MVAAACQAGLPAVVLHGTRAADRVAEHEYLLVALGVSGEHLRKCVGLEFGGEGSVGGPGKVPILSLPPS